MSCQLNEEYVWYTDLSKKFLEQDYLLPGQSLDERVSVICETAEKYLKKPGFGKKLKANLKKGWYSLSTPIWANFGTDRGLPISCYNSNCLDTSASIIRMEAEVSMMTKLGGGTSAYFGNLRGRGGKIRYNGFSSGSVHFMQIFENVIKVWAQGGTRKGNFAAYQDIDHPDAPEFLTIRSEGSPIQELSFGLCVPDYWLCDMVDGDLKKRELWAKVLENRVNKGYPYILFTDNVNNQRPAWYIDNALFVKSSNLCIETTPTSNEEESFVCDLASMNLLYFDDWKDDPEALEILVYLLDAVMTEFIEKAKKIPFMERAVRYAERHRSLGIGWLGYHSYLQSKMIPFESMTAKLLNIKIAKNIQQGSINASMKAAEEYGEPELLKGYGRRHALLQAIAPTKSSAFILGQISENIEANRSNYFIKNLAKGKYSSKNPILQKTLKEKGKDVEEVWMSILKNFGSVNHLDFLSAEEKAVFKTFAEISPMEMILQAAQRQKFIDQSQSLNIMIPPGTPVREINALTLKAHELGVKSLYYQYSQNAAQSLSRSILTCSSCES